MFQAMTNEPPTTFSEDTIDFLSKTPPDIFEEYEIPEVFENIIMSTGMVRLLMKLLAKSPSQRP
jgi:hypothetical protein